MKQSDRAIGGQSLDITQDRAPRRLQTLGLQAADQIDPRAGPHVGGSELSLSDTDRDTVDQLHAEWTAHGVPIALEPTDLAFGYTFVATEPDGHRLRVCATDTAGLN